MLFSCIGPCRRVCAPPLSARDSDGKFPAGRLGVRASRHEIPGAASLFHPILPVHLFVQVILCPAAASRSWVCAWIASTQSRKRPFHPRIVQAARLPLQTSRKPQVLRLQQAQDCSCTLLNRVYTHRRGAGRDQPVMDMPDSTHPRVHLRLA